MRTARRDAGRRNHCFHKFFYLRKITSAINYSLTPVFKTTKEKFLIYKTLASYLCFYRPSNDNVPTLPLTKERASYLDKIASKSIQNCNQYGAATISHTNIPHLLKEIKLVQLNHEDLIVSN